jgi:hypothetical protein
MRAVIEATSQLQIPTITHSANKARNFAFSGEPQNLANR